MRVLSALFLALACCACTSANSTPPAPTGSATGSPVRGSAQPREHGGVTARWVPNLNWKHAHTVVTHGSTRLARKLRHDIAVAKPFPRGVFACPADFGVQSRLTLRIGDAVDHRVVRLSGCATVTVPGRRARVVSPALLHDLATIAPKRWQRYLRG